MVTDQPKPDKPSAQERRKLGPPALSVWRHYKGGEYLVITTAVIEATCEPCVVYESIAHGYRWVRPMSAWEELVEHEGRAVPRFVRVN